MRRTEAQIASKELLSELGHVYLMATELIDAIDSVTGDSWEERVKALRAACERTRLAMIEQNRVEIIARNERWVQEDMFQRNLSDFDR